jgi:hypothetical protein
MNAKFLVGFLLTCAYSAILFWIGGYDFNHRSPVVAFSVFMTMLLASIIGISVKEKI